MRINSPLLIKLAGRVAGNVLRLLFRTLYIELHTGSVNPYGEKGEGHYLFPLWHDSAVMGTFGGRTHDTLGLTSRHRDGTFVAAILRTVNVRSIRGSSGRTGQRAARELIKEAAEHDIVITPDGPRGPRRVMSRGIIFLASKSGARIVPSALVCSNAWEVQGSWTSLTIPKPFSRVVIVVGEPVHVPANLSDREIESCRETVQQRMDELQNLAQSELDQPTGAPFSASKPVTPAVLDNAA